MLLILGYLQKYARIFNLISSSTQFYPQPYLLHLPCPKVYLKQRLDVAVAFDIPLCHIYIAFWSSAEPSKN